MSFPILRVRALIKKDEHLLLARLEDRPVAFLPGGRVAAAETLEFAIQRELIEETGSSASALTYLGAIEHHWEEKGRIINDLTHFFYAEGPGWSLSNTPICDDEGVIMFWLPVSQINDSQIQPAIQKDFIVRFLMGDRSPWWATVRDV